MEPPQGHTFTTRPEADAFGTQIRLTENVVRNTVCPSACDCRAQSDA